MTDGEGGSTVSTDVGVEAAATSVMATTCPGGGALSELPMPSAAAQPFLAQLRFANPQTLAATLSADRDARTTPTI
jgi:hypothetical protein